MKRKRVIMIDISLGSYQTLMSNVISLAQNRRKSFVCFANVHMAIETFLCKDLRNKINSSALTNPDGIPIAKALKLLYNIPQERVAGMDAFPDLLMLAEQNSLSVFLFGSTTKVLKNIESRVLKEFPDLKIAGSFSPPFQEDLNNEKYVEMINNSNANLVFVSLGCPKQEKWMADNTNKINGVLIGIGAAFGVYAGVNKRAPKWMQISGLEWFYRLLQNPRRLWKRYIYTNTLFIILLAIQKAKQSFKCLILFL